MSIELLAPLVPMLPSIASYILGKAEDTVISEVTKKLFGEFTEKGKDFVAKYFVRIIDDAEVVEAAKQLESKPESVGRAIMLQEELARVLATHPELLQEFQQLQSSAVTQTGNRNLSFGGNNSGTANTGDNNTFTLSK